MRKAMTLAGFMALVMLALVLAVSCQTQKTATQAQTVIREQTICEFFWRAAAGFGNGLAAGYLSHLVLDAGTPRSIPLLTNGF